MPEGTVPLPAERNVAGLSSMSSKVVREPAFTHKRKVGPRPPINDRVVQGMKFSDEKMNLDNQALKFKSGMRRSMEKWPTEYKLQYGWKDPAALPVPLLQAQEALSHHHHPACPNKPADHHDGSVESADGGSCDSAESDQDNPVEQEPTVAATRRPATAAIKKQLHQKQKARTQPVHRKQPRVSRNVTTTLHHKPTAPTKTDKQPQVAPNKTTVTKKMVEQGNDTSGSDTDSQTGQKVQPQQRTTNSHRTCGHKIKKKRNVKRKLVWPMITEYQSQYKSKEVPAMIDGDDAKPPAGSPQKLVDNSDPRLLKHSPLKLFKLQPENVKFTSEYLANYQSPTKMKYKEGAWSGASPPHLLPQAWTTTAADHNGDAKSDTTGNDWFNQVLELRRLAATYRRRAEGTHFVQVHLADIEGEDDDDVTSTASSCSVCYHHQQQPPVAPPPRSHDSNALPTKSHDPIIPVSRRTRPPPTKSHDIKPPPTGSHDPQDDTENTSSKHDQDTEPPTGYGLPCDEETSVDGESEHDKPQGRLPTPELKQMPPARKIRHHLDRTTPCKGAILTSPPKEARHNWNPEEDAEENEDPLIDPIIPHGITKTLPRYRRDMTSHAPIYPTHTIHTDDQPDRQTHIITRKKRHGVSSNRKSVTKQQRSLHKTQTLIPSRKITAANGRIKVTEDDPMECSFCGSSLHQAAHKSSWLPADNRPLAMHGITTTLPKTNTPQQPQKAHLPLSQRLSQQQPLSGSLLSLSSCSVASEVLQRAQHRKATFWNQQGTTAT